MVWPSVFPTYVGDSQCGKKRRWSNGGILTVADGFSRIDKTECVFPSGGI